MTGVLIYTSIFCEKMHAIFLVYAISGRVGSVESLVSAIGTLRVICSLWIVNKVALLITFSHMTISYAILTLCLSVCLSVRLSSSVF